MVGPVLQLFFYFPEVNNPSVGYFMSEGSFLGTMLMGFAKLRVDVDIMPVLPNSVNACHIQA